MVLCARSVTLVLAAGAASAQDPPPPSREPQPPARAPEPAADEGRAEGRALLTRMVDAQRDVAQMTADYVQERTTALTRKPLVSRGKLAFRREPGCVVFTIAEPRPGVIRLDTKHYEVWRPDQNRLERFVLPSDEMPRLLFDALGPTQAKLDAGFAVAACTPVADAPGQRDVKLVPTAPSSQAVASAITLTIDTQGPALRAFAYQDPRGDKVRITLENLTHAARADDARFTLAVPADAEVVVQRIPAARLGAKETPAKTGEAARKPGDGGR